MLKNFWYVAEESSNVTDKPVHTRLLGQNFVLFRDEGGKLSCLSDVCVHRGAALSQGRVVNGCVECPYHGWQYNGEGECTKIPAQPDNGRKGIPKKARVDSYPVEERYGWVWVFVGDLPAEQRPPIPEFPEYTDTQNWRCIRGEWNWDADQARVIENGIDFAHAPFVHAGKFGDPNEAEIEDFEVETHEWGATASVHYNPPTPKGLWKVLRRHNPEKVRKVVARPGFHMSGGLMRLEVQITPKMKMIIYDVNTPIDEGKTKTRWVMARNFFKGSWADSDARRRTLAIFEQDDAVLRKVKPELLPVDLSEELSVKSDGLQIAFRKTRKKFVDMGWSIDQDRLKAEVTGKRAAVIPSPKRTQDPQGWVLSPVPFLEGKRLPQAAE
jgi:phenylpropionate dioxygenase-like ring-hydroxylating dioxygenase large terminal subunit